MRDDGEPDRAQRPLAGTRLDIDGSDDEILVGADPDCRLALDLPGVSPIHARLSQDQGELVVHDTRSPRGVYVNDTRVTGQAPLRDGDVLWLGRAGEDESVMCSAASRVARPPRVVLQTSPADSRSCSRTRHPRRAPASCRARRRTRPADAVDPMGTG
jgi:predicted component of type VI protein secretion system